MKDEWECETLPPSKMALWDWIEQESPCWRFKDKDYWKALYKKANAEVIMDSRKVKVGEREVVEPQSWNYASTRTYIEPIYKTIPLTPAQRLREIRWTYRQPKLNNNTYGEKIDAWLHEQFLELSKDCDCVDGYRVAEANNRADMRRYRKIKGAGCCGFSDSEVWYKTWWGGRRKFMVGFNYGH